MYLKDFAQRVKGYAIKAFREARRHITWTEPNEKREEGCTAFIDHLLEPTLQNVFWSDFLPFQKEIRTYVIYNSLSQTTLKITCPGLPDFYQGRNCGTLIWSILTTDDRWILR